jgi:hypothetical protein
MRFFGRWFIEPFHWRKHIANNKGWPEYFEDKPIKKYFREIFWCPICALQILIIKIKKVK